MFQFPALAPCIARCRARSPAGCPIRKSAGQGSFAPNRGFSQLITSFFASVSQGIHLAPLSTLSHISYFQLIDSSMKSISYFSYAFFFYSFLACTNMSKIDAPFFSPTICGRRGVENIGVEPMTSCLQSRRSSQLS